MGIHHQELGLPWNEPVPEDMWVKVAEYCDNDVIATEAVFNDRKADFTTRQILADVAGMSVNDTTNSLTTRIIFGNNRKPQNFFNYRNLSEVSETFSKIDSDGTVSILPHFPGYKFENGKSTYKGEEVGEGGYVYAEPGMYGNVALLDIASMHPSTIVAENLFGDKYTARFKELLDARIAIKHKEFDKARKMLGGALNKYLVDENSAADLAQALKIALNSVYGLTSASFDNPFKDPRNKDNIVAKRGALFMINLKYEVQKRGFVVAHIKTDSIKIPDATPEIIQFVYDYGKQYGYTFEHEATYDRMCLVNNAVYIAKYKDSDECKNLYDYVPSKNLKNAKKWTATGAQFAVPYVFKKLFSGDEIIFKDLCETKSVNSHLYLDMNENLPSVSDYENERNKLWKKLCSEFGNDFNRTLFDKIKNTEMGIRIDELDELIKKGHHYKFVGKIGQFCPIKPGKGGGILLREATNKKTGEVSYAAVTGSKGYRWLESEVVQVLNKEDDIDQKYYEAMVDDAIKTISKYGDFEWFVSDDPYVGPNFSDNGAPLYIVITNEDVPF